MATHRVETRLDETTIRALDGWRTGLRPPLSRAEAVRLLLEERLRGPRHERPSEVTSPPERRPSADTLGALYSLERVPGFGPVKFRDMHEAGVDPRAALEHPDRLPFGGRTGDKLRSAIRTLSTADIEAGRSRAIDQLKRASECSASILVHGDPEYPRRVYQSNNPVPFLYVRGDPVIWATSGSIALVGSRSTRGSYATAARTFATTAVATGFVVVSGFATGADTIGHMAACEAGGHTICVMPCGLDRVFPPENRNLWDELLAYAGAVFVSQFGFGQRASSLMLRKRNKLIVAFAQAVLVAQSAVGGGAMNAYRFGREQKKPIATFRDDGSSYTTGNAVIAQNRLPPDVIFDLTLDGAKYKTWLNALSSST